MFNVTPNAARKWLLGLGLPALEKGMSLAKWGRVNIEWLLTGRGPKRGNLISTRALVLDEMFVNLPPPERSESIAMLRYEIDKASPLLAKEQAARYLTALDQYERED